MARTKEKELFILGYLDSCDVFTVQPLSKFFQRRGLTVACAARHPRSRPIYGADLRGLLFLLIGGEKRGLTRPLLAQADLLLRIPYARVGAYDLSATSAAIIAFEVMRQRWCGVGRAGDE